jgi:nitrogen fixation protein FixH
MTREQHMQRIQPSFSPTITADSQRSRVASRLWPWVPVLLLTTLIGTQLVVLSSVLDDPSFATERDYYRKAVSWDEHMERARASQALGWRAEGRVAAPEAGKARLELQLRDAAGHGISGAALNVVAFANTRAAQMVELRLTELAPGRYGAELGPVRPGLWEARVEATRGMERYETTLRFEVFETQGSR